MILSDGERGVCVKKLMIFLASTLLVSITATAENILFDTTNGRIDELKIDIVNPTSDEAYNNKLIDQIRKTLGLYPGDHVTEERIDFTLASIKRNPKLTRILFKPMLPQPE